MALNPLYVTAPSIQQYFVDKDTGEPLSGGYIYFYHDNNRTVPKPVYTLAGNQANYTYTPLPNPLVLSVAGIPVDANGNPIVIYWYPFDDEGNIDLYYVRVVSSTNVPQQTVQAWPNGIGGGITPGEADNVINYIPNGQLLAHTNPPNNLLVSGSNAIAQGGFSVELPNPVLSVNTLNFQVEGYVEIPPNSPRYLCIFECVDPNTADSSKIFRIKWNDVNKFSSATQLGSQEYTFAFWATSSVPTNVSLSIHRYFGTTGSVVPDVPIGSTTITGAPTFFNFNFRFPLNTGYNVDTEDNNDFISIDIAFPTSIAFVCTLTDFVMSNTVMNYVEFPLQTNADMMTRGVMGWVDIPDGNGMDLYLPPILTKEGMTWDSSQIGTIGMDVLPIPSPNSLPAPQNNKMPCDGAIYISSEYSSNGIPYVRLLNYLLTLQPNFPNASNGVPLYGTGQNYITALCPFNNTDVSVTDIFRITYNLSGTGSTPAADGPVGFETGFSFAPAYLYGGSDTGIAPFNVFASTTGFDAGVLFKLTSGTATSAPADGTTGFTFTRIDGATEYLAFQGENSASLITTVAALGLVGGTGRYFLFDNGITNYYVWFNVDGTNTDPAIGGRTGIQVNLKTLFTAENVAHYLREALLGLASTEITVTGTPPAGSYFTFSSNPGAIRNFYAWYTVDGLGVDPSPVGMIGIEIKILSTSTVPEIRDITRFTINTYQFAAPLFDGLFFRAADPNGLWDFDYQYRSSGVCGVGGAVPGTFEYSQFLSHNHIYISPLTGVFEAGGGSGGPLAQNTTNSGGTETRPVNTYIYPFIRY